MLVISEKAHKKLTKYSQQWTMFKKLRHDQAFDNPTRENRYNQETPGYLNGKEREAMLNNVFKLLIYQGDIV